MLDECCRNLTTMNDLNTVLPSVQLLTLYVAWKERVAIGMENSIRIHSHLKLQRHEQGTYEFVKSNKRKGKMLAYEFVKTRTVKWRFISWCTPDDACFRHCGACKRAVQWEWRTVQEYTIQEHKERTRMSSEAHEENAMSFWKHRQ